MLARVGQALREARLKKNLSVEEVSRATKIRAARIVDLENDDYMRFPNITYARSFLVLYAKFLGVDITKYPTVEAGSTVGLADYQYLQSDETPAPQRTRQEPQKPPEKPRWLIIFFVFLVMLVIGALIGWGVMNLKRLGPVENFVKKENGAVATPMPTPTPVPTATPAPSPAPEATVIPPPPPEPEVRRAEPVSSGSSDEAVLAAAATPAVPTIAAGPAVFPPPGAVREIKVRATKKVRVRIVRDNPKSGSLYLGYVNPQQPALTYRGQSFWIKTTDPTALQVTIDGQPVTGPEAGVEIIQSPSF